MTSATLGRWPRVGASARALALTVTLSAALIASGCGGEDGGAQPTPPVGKLTTAVSKCGGFAPAAQSSVPRPTGYCDAETLGWRYDAATRTLTIEDQRAKLNCCGERRVEVKRVGDTIVVEEIDGPGAQQGRCRCECVYDFRASIPDVDPGQVRLQLSRRVTDANEPPKALFDGQLDLARGSGQQVLDASSAGSFCNPPAPAPFANARVSECGGFASTTQKSGGSGDTFDGNAGNDYCKAEVLDWSFDARSGVLALRNNRVVLNCCGDHDISVSKSGNRYVIRETDAPKGDARCGCMCVFDFAIDVKGVAAGKPIEITVERHVTDNGAAKVVYSGTLDLGASKGSAVLDSTDAGPWCNKNQ